MPTRDEAPAGEAPTVGEALNPGAADPEAALQTLRNHDAIARLADDLLPALIAKLAASGLGEIEVRESGWKARLRMPAPIEDARRSGGRAADGHSTHAPAHGAAGHARSEERDRRLRPEPEVVEEPGLVAAKSPAVGVYQPRRDLVVGMRVRAGDRIGSVNVLGVGQDVVAPVDGVIGSSLAEAGEAVEYGQELVRIELPERDPEAEGGVPVFAGVAGKA
jgi:biotin carboxyl carrier protein